MMEFKSEGKVNGLTRQKRFDSQVIPKSTGLLRSLENPEAGNGKESFKVSKVAAVRPDNLVIPHFLARNDAQGKNDNTKTSKSTLRTIVENKVSKDTPVHRYISVMNPVRSLPRSSHLIKMEKQQSLSRENIGSSSDSLNEGSQKKARLKIPKPSKQVTVKSRSEDKERKKKEDGNNNNKKSADSLERRSKRLTTRRQSSKDLGLAGVDQIKAQASLQKQDSKDYGNRSPTDSPSRDRTSLLRVRNQMKVSFEDSQREKPRSSSTTSAAPIENPSVKIRPRRNTERIMRDYRLSTVDVQALKCLLDKVDLYDSEVRDMISPLLKDGTVSQEASASDGEKLSEKVITDSEKEGLKEKLFLSRKELDSYISFCKKMEREKRQTISEKEDLATKTQWLEKRMSLIENENKALKIERSELLNQVYKLRCPANVPIAERGRVNTRSSKDGEESQSEVEVSRQRLLYEADAFAQERSKMIKERQRLDEEVRKVQIRCVSLLAQLQHSEKTVDELQNENEALKLKLENSATKMMNEQKILQEKIKDVEEIIGVEGAINLDRRMSTLLTHVKNTEDDKFKLNQETSHLLRRIDEVTRDNRLLTEEKLNLEYEVMSLRDTLKADQKAKNECEVKLAEVDTKLHHVQAELRLANDHVTKHESEREGMVDQIEEMNSKMIDMKRNEVELESERIAFQKFIEMLSLEMEEKLGEEIVSTDAEADSLQEKAELLGKQISAHLTPSRKIAENVQDLKEEVDDLKQENKALKYAMSCRLEIQNMQVTQQSCNCSSEKEMMKRELEEIISINDHLEDEVKRLHEDKQSLLMSFLNLQAASKSREPSRSGIEGSDEDSGDVTDTEDEDTDEEEQGRGNDEEAGETDESDEVSDDDQISELRHSSDNGSTRSPLRKTVSLPIDSNRRKVEAPGKPITPDDVIANLEMKLEEMRKTKEVLEDERVCLLDTICKQDQQVAELRDELERVEDELDEVKDQALSTSQGESCSNCSKSLNEIRQYLGIIQTLTEDKLSLEKSLSDIRRDKEQLMIDIETVTQERFVARSELENLKSEMEEAGKKYQKEMESLLQNLDGLEQENKTLEEHLQNIRQNKLDLLEDLKMAEQDRLGLVKSLQALTVDQGNVEGSVSEESTKPIIVEDYIDESSDMYSYAQYLPKRRARRSVSTPQKHGNPKGDDPRQIIDSLQQEMAEMSRALNRCTKDNMELRKALEKAEALLQMEQNANRELERDKLVANEEILCLKNEIERLKPVRKTPSIRTDTQSLLLEDEGVGSNFEDASIRHASWSNLAIPHPEKEKTRRRKISAPCGPSKSLGERSASTPILARTPSVSKAKTLCFQISFNGMTLMEKTDFGEE